MSEVAMERAVRNPMDVLRMVMHISSCVIGTTVPVLDTKSHTAIGYRIAALRRHP
jgi:hypothetical protein